MNIQLNAVSAARGQNCFICPQAVPGTFNYVKIMTIIQKRVTLIYIHDS